LATLSCTRKPGRAGLDSTAELARDWDLFQAVESERVEPMSRSWQTDTTTVVAGRHGDLGRDVIQQACRADGVPVVRRFSGGGTVVLGAGCLNYAVALSLASHPGLNDVAASTRMVLDAIVEALDVEGLAIDGSDLVIRNRKVSGSAQRRGRRALLQHGTLLYEFDARLAARYLTEPVRRPAYRGRRAHCDFLGNLPLSRDEIQVRLRDAWRALGAVDRESALAGPSI